jgi:hypothetical protein
MDAEMCDSKYIIIREEDVYGINVASKIHVGPADPTH